MFKYTAHPSARDCPPDEAVQFLITPVGMEFEDFFRVEFLLKPVKLNSMDHDSVLYCGRAATRGRLAYTYTVLHHYSILTTN